MAQSALAWPAASLDREHELERVRAALGAVANPYGAEHGLAFEDPDGFQIVLEPAQWDRWFRSLPAPER